MPALALAAAAWLAAAAQASDGWGPGAQRGPGRLPPSPPPAASTSPAPAPPPRVPIDLGWDTPTAEPPQRIDILAPPVTSEAASAAVLKECDDQREAGVVSGEIVVCRKAEEDTSQMLAGSHEAWLKAYAERTMNAGTLPTPDVAGPGIFTGAPTISGLCLIPPCPKAAALMIDVTAIEAPPAGSDAERVAQGLAPRESDDAPLAEDARRRIAAELGLPDVAKPAPPAPPPGG